MATVIAGELGFSYSSWGLFAVFQTEQHTGFSRCVVQLWKTRTGYSENPYRRILVSVIKLCSQTDSRQYHKKSGEHDG